MKILILTFVTSLALSGAVRLSAQSPIRDGDRIAIVGNTFADQLRIHGYLETLLLQHWTGHPVSIRNLGWGGDMLGARDRPAGFPSEESTLAAHKTDVIVACFGVGESFAGESGLNEFRDDLKVFIRSHSGKRYNGESDVRLILVSPIAYEDLGSITPAQKRRDKELEAYTRAMGEVAAAGEVPFIDLYGASRYLMDERGPNLTNNGIHLNQYGYWALSRTFYSQLVKGDRSAEHQAWKLIVDVREETTDARGVSISELKVEPKGISFQVAEESNPSLPPPTNELLPPQLIEHRDRLFVKGLAPGAYALTVDGEPVATANEKDWAIGVAIDSSPSHKKAEVYRAAVNDKNLQFTYSWKALNQVHIVGERRKSPSGRALPEEVRAFNKLADERDRGLAKGVEFPARLWRLSRVER